MTSEPSSEGGSRAADVAAGAPSAFDALYGLDVLSLSGDEVTARVRVEARHLQPAGFVHGGVVASMAESMASYATHLAVREQGLSAQGLSNHTSFIRPLGGPEVLSVARCRHRGRTTWIWDVEAFDAERRLCALTRMTVAVR